MAQGIGTSYFQAGLVEVLQEEIITTESRAAFMIFIPKHLVWVLIKEVFLNKYKEVFVNTWYYKGFDLLINTPLPRYATQISLLNNL
jgi:hypothetical protein